MTEKYSILSRNPDIELSGRNVSLNPRDEINKSNLLTSYSYQQLVDFFTRWNFQCKTKTEQEKILLKTVN